VCEQENAINVSERYQNSPDYSPLVKPIRIKVSGYARGSNNSTLSFQTSKESISNVREVIKNPTLKARFLNSKAGKPPQAPQINKKFESD